jgi:hypothetical protein
MALCFLLDEHLRGPLWHGIQQHNAKGAQVLDVLRVGDPPAPPLGTPDPDNLLWAEQHGRIIVTEDRRTMPVHLADHLQAGHHSPGVFISPHDWTVPQIIFSLVLHDQVGAPQDYIDRIEYL